VVEIIRVIRLHITKYLKSTIFKKIIKIIINLLINI